MKANLLVFRVRVVEDSLMRFKITEFRWNERFPPVGSDDLQESSQHRLAFEAYVPEYVRMNANPGGGKGDAIKDSICKDGGKGRNTSPEGGKGDEIVASICEDGGTGDEDDDSICEDVTPGYFRGIENVEKSCFANAVLQLLATLKLRFSDDTLQKAYAGLDLLNENRKRLVADPSTFLEAVRGVDNTNSFPANEEHDPHEFLMYIFSKVDLQQQTMFKIVTKKAFVCTATKCQHGRCECVRLLSSSFFLSGALTYIIALLLDRESAPFSELESFLILPLDVPEAPDHRPTTVQACLDRFLAGSEVDGKKCEMCRTQGVRDLSVMVELYVFCWLPANPAIPL
jgi:hypothetical protein